MTRIFHLSDIHFGAEHLEAVEWARACIERERPDAVCITGDLTIRARHREFAAATRWISGLGVPVTVEVGNHDMPYFNLVERFVDPYRRFRAIKSMVEREIDLPGLAIVPLKTATRAQWRFPWSNGWVTNDALERTLEAIAQVPTGDRVIVTAHHPLIERSAAGKRLTINGENAMAALAGSGVLAILTGHVHDAFDLVQETSAGPLRMIGAGTLSRRLRLSPPSFNELSIDETGIRVTVRNLGNIPTKAMQVNEIPEGAKPPVR